MRMAGIVAAVALSLAAPRAHADTSKAWTAAKAGLPGDATLVVGIDVTVLLKTPLFSTLFSILLARPEFSNVQEPLQAVKDTCKVDPLAAVQSAVVATSADRSDGAVYLAVTGVDKAKVADCLKRAGEADGGNKLSIKQDGNITQLTEGSKSWFLGWVGKDVIVVSSRFADKASLTKWMSGKGTLAKSTLGKRLAKVNMSALIWGARDGDHQLHGITTKGFHGAVIYANGTFDAEIHVVPANVKDTTAIADGFNQEIARQNQGDAKIAAGMVALLKTVKVAVTNDEVVVKASIAERDLLNAVAIGPGPSP